MLALTLLCQEGSPVGVSFDFLPRAGYFCFWTIPLNYWVSLWSIILMKALLRHLLRRLIPYFALDGVVLCLNLSFTLKKWIMLLKSHYFFSLFNLYFRWFPVDESEFSDLIIWYRNETPKHCVLTGIEIVKSIPPLPLVCVEKPLSRTAFCDNAYLSYFWQVFLNHCQRESKIDWRWWPKIPAFQSTRKAFWHPSWRDSRCPFQKRIMYDTLAVTMSEFLLTTDLICRLESVD